MKDYKGLILMGVIILFTLCFISFTSALVINVTSSSATMYIDGLYTVYNFTTNGTFNVTGANLNVSVLIIAGGGGGSGGGGGAGGLIWDNDLDIIVGNYTVVVGSGGAGAGGTVNNGGNGANSSFYSLNALGGGGGGEQGVRAYNGGSGGGEGYDAGATVGIGLGLIGQGNNGGLKESVGSPFYSGGGGGAGTVGLDGGTTFGMGGNGSAYSINGTSIYYAGGGGGGTYSAGTAGVGGLGGGGNGGANVANGVAGVNGLGAGGGGGGSTGTGGNGGSGRVIIRYLTSSLTANYTINSETHNALTYETITSESYSINITQNDTPTNAYLIYNGTSYSTTITSSGGGNYYSLNRTLPIASSMVGLNTFYYSWNVSSTEQVTSSNYSQTVSSIQFGLCNASLTVPYLNFTFKDEDTLGYIKGSIPSSIFTYYLGDETINKTLTFVNTTANYVYTFCSLPADKTYYIKTYIQYKNDTGYPQRIFEDIFRAYTNSTTNKTLYLLDSTQGIYVTYQVLDGIGNQLSGVQVTVNRTIEGNSYTVGTGLTDSSGTITFWLNPDFVHSLSFDKSGYTSFYLSHFPTQTAYTITLGQSSSSTLNDYIRGITYTFQPNFGTTLNVSQLYNFNLTFNSTYWNTSSFGFILYGDGIVIGGNSSTSLSGYIDNTLNISNYEHISVKIYWVVNGTTTYGINNGWFTFDYTEGTGWSIDNFFKDLKNYTSPTYHPETDSYTGIFGLNTNSLNFIIFVIIFLVTGLVSYKFSFTSPTVVTGVIFGLTFLFDVALGLITMPFLTVVHFPTIFILLIAVASAIWEFRR
jgi:hypothetical protein